MNSKIQPTVLIDTREQVPFEFANLPSEAATLTTGDYSIKGLDHLVAVERKHLGDFLGCVGASRDRFKRELQRMLSYRFRMLIIETDYATLARGDWESKVRPTAVLGSIAAWMAQYSLPVMLGRNHDEAGMFTERYLYQCARCVAQEQEAANGEPSGAGGLEEKKGCAAGS